MQSDVGRSKVQVHGEGPHPFSSNVIIHRAWAANHFSILALFCLCRSGSVLEMGRALARGVRGVRQGIKEVSMVK